MTERFCPTASTNCWSTKWRIRPVSRIPPSPISSCPTRRNRSSRPWPFSRLLPSARRHRPAPRSIETVASRSRWLFTCAPPNSLKMVFNYIHRMYLYQDKLIDFFFILHSQFVVVAQVEISSGTDHGHTQPGHASQRGGASQVSPGRARLAFRHVLRYGRQRHAPFWPGL